MAEKLTPYIKYEYQLAIAESILYSVIIPIFFA